MSAFLKLNTATTPPSTKEASGTEYDYAVNQILTTFAATDTGAGTLSVNPAPTTGLTLIGSFTDTYYPYDQLQHGTPVGTVLTSTVYNFYQDLGTETESLTRPLEFSTGAVREQSDTALNADLIAEALSNLVSIGVGSYNLSTTAPVGGTWVSKATITNNLDVNESNSTTLWRKTAAATAPTTIRPVKINPTTPPSIKEMSDAEIQTLTNRMRNRIVATGIGSYSIQGTAPVSGGTWTTAGAQFSDTRRTLSSIAYNGTYAGTYVGSFTGSYTAAYTGSYTGTFTGSYVGSFTGSYAGIINHTYAGFIQKNFTGSYTGLTKYAGYARPGSPAVAYAGTYVNYYARNYTGTYARSYSGTYNQAFAGSYNQSFAGTYNRAYAGSYNQSFTGNYAGAYTGVTLNNDSLPISSVYLWIRTA